MEQFSTANERARELRISLPTLYRLARGGEIAAVRVGRQWRFPRDMQQPQAPAGAAAAEREARR